MRLPQRPRSMISARSRISEVSSWLKQWRVPSRAPR
jgi:hypothetical protein